MQESMVSRESIYRGEDAQAKEFRSEGSGGVRTHGLTVHISVEVLTRTTTYHLERMEALFFNVMFLNVFVPSILMRAVLPGIKWLFGRGRPWL